MEVDVALKDAVKTSVFAEARLAEIKSIVQQLKDCDHGRRAFQTLPRHMQRRQVSSNPRRLPSYLRDQHKREGGNNAKVTRRPSRKHRRRPRNLLEEYNRRQKDHVWLETHIWHAKRFQLVKRFGYNLPDFPSCRGYRSSLKAAKTTCLVQDVSYMSCIELEGKPTTLLSGLSKITQPSCLASLTRPVIMQGQQWEIVTIFTPDTQPYGAVGDVDILWLPPLSSSSDKSSENARLWIWIHPSAHSHVVEILVGVYNLVKVENSSEQAFQVKVEVDSSEQAFQVKAKENVADIENFEIESSNRVPVNDNEKNDSTLSPMETGGNNQDSVTETSSPVASRKRKGESSDSGEKKKKTKDVNMMKLEKRNIPFEKTPKYHSVSTQVSMTLLKDTLSRFRLVGPESLQVLKAALCPAKLFNAESVDDDELLEDERKDRAWCRDYYCNEERVKIHEAQVQAWKKLSSSHLNNRMVLPLTVRDPRITLPRKKSPLKPGKDTDKNYSFPHWPIDSPMYASAMRDRVVLSKEPDAKVNERRSQRLVPGSELPEGPEESRLPVLMFSRSSSHSIGYGSGLDVVVCSGWGMSVWLPIVMNGGVAGGQNAAESLHMEFLTPLTSNLFPDTPSGDYHSAVIGLERRTEYFKRPPACRNNFLKLGVQYPFAPPWRKLVQEWVAGTEDIFVLRDAILLRYLATQFGDAFSALKRTRSKFNDDDDTLSVGSSAPSLDLAITEGSDELQDCSIVKTDIQNISEIPRSNNAEEELGRSKQGCLVRVKLILEGKGSLESCAMICMPTKEDLEGKGAWESSSKKFGVFEEPSHVDMQHEHRQKLKKEHKKVKRQIHNLKVKTKEKLEKETNAAGFVQRGASFKRLTEMALDSLKDTNKTLFAKQGSYNQHVEELWLMKRDEALQCCSRKIMGYLNHGTFSMTLGRGAGIGWVALKPLLDRLQMYKELQLHNDTEDNVNQSVNSVLVRNPTSLQYYWATLSIIK